MKQINDLACEKYKKNIYLQILNELSLNLS